MSDTIDETLSCPFRYIIKQFYEKQILLLYYVLKVLRHIHFYYNFSHIVHHILFHSLTFYAICNDEALDNFQRKHFYLRR